MTVLAGISPAAHAQGTLSYDAEPASHAVPALSPQDSGVTGKVADSAVGRAGKRQSRFAAKGIQPTVRINDRIANRIQSRIGNRIDFNYSPDANAASAFVAAAEEARRAGRPR